MDNIINSAPLYTGVCDSATEPHYNSDICKDCNGVGKRNYSDCCGEVIADGKCIYCGDYCVACHDICETCGGEGEL
jgi:hypothetical protein